MRYKGCVRQDIRTGELLGLPFRYEHYGAANALFTPFVGMHVISALELVNKWNHTDPYYKYWLEVVA